MAICSKCGKGSLNAVSRSHSNIATKRKQHPNLQTKTLDGKRVKICSKCIKAMKKPAKK